MSNSADVLTEFLSCFQVSACLSWAWWRNITACSSTWSVAWRTLPNTLIKRPFLLLNVLKSVFLSISSLVGPMWLCWSWWLSLTSSSITCLRGWSGERAHVCSRAQFTSLCLSVAILTAPVSSGSSFPSPAWSVTTSWPTCLASSLDALPSSRSSRFSELRPSFPSLCANEWSLIPAAVTQEDLGGLYWGILLHHCVWDSGENCSDICRFSLGRGSNQSLTSSSSPTSWPATATLCARWSSTTIPTVSRWTVSRRSFSSSRTTSCPASWNLPLDGWEAAASSSSPPPNSTAWNLLWVTFHSYKELCDLACFFLLANTAPPSPSPQTTVRLYPFQIHSIALSSFASIVGPFGGFFASGFKRAFKIKVAGKQTSFFLDQWLFQTKDHLTQKYTLMDHLTHLAKYPPKQFAK